MTAKVALFVLGARKYALPVERIIHIRAMERMHVLPRLRQGIAGLFVVSDGIAPLLDLGAVFADSVWGDSGRAPLLVVFGSETGPVGLAADKVLQVVDRSQGKTQELPGEQRREGVDAYFFHQGEGIPLLHVDALVSALSA